MADTAGAGETKELSEPLAQGSLRHVPDAPGGDTPTTPAVRFRSTVEEISDPEKLSTGPSQDLSVEFPGVSAEELRELSKSLQGSHLQERRMNIFAFEPFSLPASRTPSHEGELRDPSREHTHSSGGGHHSPLLSPRWPEMHSPPLTPAGTGQAEVDPRAQEYPADGRGRSLRPDIITPQESSQDAAAHSSAPKLPHRPASSGDVQKRPASSEGKEHAGSGIADHRKGLFGPGPGGGSGSLPVSRDASPSRAAAASQFYTRPLTPSGDANDPYAANKRQPQNKIEARFVFSKSKRKHGSPDSSSLSVPKSPAHEKRHSGIFGHHKKDDALHHDESTTPTIHSRQSSMSDLKRFFKMGAHHKMKRAASPAPSVRSANKVPTGQSRAQVQIPFGDDHGLTSKYGKLGKVLGSGAGGSVRLMKRSEDNTVFAVKEFRPRHTYETEREYVKKLTAEYCIGSSLHHGNIIETLDIVQEKTKWFEVMEYAPYDLFAIVMTGKMSRAEVACCFLQILSGVTYLHSMGLAHRDLKLDNVVVSDRGIMKIIDFGSAHVFKYPFENGIVMATGIVGSDPYLAPEVYDERKYDPTAVDIWSLAIIFCCMTLRRFPWKVPRMTDNSFKLFAADPTPGHDPKKLILPPSRSTADLSSTAPRDIFTEKREENKGNINTSGANEEKAPGPAGEKPAESAGPEKKEVIRGPWRILRLLPRESRHVIGRMLELNPRERIKMPELLEDPWVANTVICRQLEPGFVINAEDHTHILEGPTPPTK